MIDVEVVGRIRRLFYAEHWRVGTIAKELGLHHETVQRALSEGARAPAGPRGSLFDPYAGFVRETLERHPKLRATRLWQMLRERGCPLGVRQVRDRVRVLRPNHQEAFLRRRTFAGEEAQVDWASFGSVTIGAARRALSAFVLTLTFSRWFFLRFFLDQSLESFLRGHVHAFADLQGVSRYCLYDNLRSAVLDRYGEGVRFNPRLLELASHYHFAPRACRPARGSEKGAVERTIRYVRDSFFAARSFSSIEDLNRQALLWRDEVAGARRWPGDDRKTVAEAFEQERQQLLSLPAHPFETELVVPVRSAKTIYVRFDLNDYSIPPAAVGRQLACLRPKPRSASSMVAARSPGTGAATTGTRGSRTQPTVTRCSRRSGGHGDLCRVPGSTMPSPVWRRFSMRASSAASPSRPPARVSCCCSTTTGPPSFRRQWPRLWHGRRHG